MKKRMLLMLVVVGAFVVAIGGFKYFQVQAAIAGGASFQPPPEAVTTVVAERERWDTTIEAIGTVTAVQGVTVAADLPGVVARIDFESGRTVREGDLLVALDARQEEAQLKAALAGLELSRVQHARIQGLRREGIMAQAELDRVEAEHTQAEARVGEIRATIERKTLRAPFTGLLGIRQVDLGQYLEPGAPVVSLQSLHPVYVDFSVPQQQLGKLRDGTQVEVTWTGAQGVAVRGRVTALDSIVDEATRNVRVQATFDNQNGVLRPGMFVEANVQLGEGAEHVTLPASAISYAAYGDSVFVVEDLAGEGGATYRGVRQQFVELGPARGDQVAVVSGIEPGAEVVTSGVFKLRNGAAVQVNNQVQPANDPAPRPENS